MKSSCLCNADDKAKKRRKKKQKVTEIHSDVFSDMQCALIFKVTATMYENALRYIGMFPHLFMKHKLRISFTDSY